MLCNAMVSDKPGGPECVQPPSPPGKLTTQLKSPFSDSCFTRLCGVFFLTGLRSALLWLQRSVLKMPNMK